MLSAEENSIPVSTDFMQDSSPENPNDENREEDTDYLLRTENERLRKMVEQLREQVLQLQNANNVLQQQKDRIAVQLNQYAQLAGRKDEVMIAYENGSLAPDPGDEESEDSSWGKLKSRVKKKLKG